MALRVSSGKISLGGSLAVPNASVLSAVDGKSYDLNISDARPTIEVEVWQGRLVVCATHLTSINGTTSGLFNIDPITDVITSMLGSGSDFYFGTSFLSVTDDKLYALSGINNGVYNLVAYDSVTSTSADTVQASVHSFGVPGGLSQLDDGTFTWGHTNGSNAGTGIKQTTFPTGPVSSNVVNTPAHSGSYAVIENYNGTNLWVAGETNNASTIICYNVNSEDPITGTYTRFAPAILTGRDTNGPRATRTYSAVLTTGNISWLIVNGVNKIAWTDDDGATSNIVNIPNGLFVCDLHFGDMGTSTSVVNDVAYFCATDNNAGTTGNNYLMAAYPDGTIEQLYQLPVPPGAVATFPGRLIIERDALGQPVALGIPMTYETGGGVDDLYIHHIPDRFWKGRDPYFQQVETLIGFENGLADDTGAPDWIAAGGASVTSTNAIFGSEATIPTSNGDYIYRTGLPSWTGPFTYELWTQAAPKGGTPTLTDTRNTGDGTGVGEFSLYYTGGALRFFTAGADRITGSIDVRDGNPHHIALTRDENNDIRLFVDGQLEGTDPGRSGTFAHVAGPTTDGFLVGAASSTLGIAPWDGVVDEIRITNGVARYTEAFVPPTRSFPRKG